MPVRKEPIDEHILIIDNLPFQPGMDSTITWKPVKDLVRIIINRDGNGKITQDNEPGKVNVEEYHTPDGSIVPYALCSLKGERSYKRALDGIAGNSWHGFTLTAQLGQIVAKNFVFLEQRTDNKNPIALESLSPIKDESILQRSQRIVHPYSPRRLVRGQQQVLRATMTTSFYRGPRNQRSSSQVSSAGFAPPGGSMCSGPQNTWVQEQISNAVHCHVSNSAHVWAERSNIIPPLCPMLPTGPPSIQYRQVSETVTAQVYAVSPTHTVNGIIPLGQRPEPYRRAFQTPGYGQPSYNNSINNRGLTSHPNNALAQGGLSRIIIAKNLSQKTTAAELKIYFSTAGAVDNVELKCNTGSNGDKCTATITFKQPEQASLAAKEFNGREFQGRRLMIQYKWEGSVKDDTEDLEGKLSELKVADEAAQSQTVSDGPVIANGSDEEINEGTSTFRKSK